MKLSATRSSVFPPINNDQHMHHTLGSPNERERLLQSGRTPLRGTKNATDATRSMDFLKNKTMSPQQPLYNVGSPTHSPRLLRARPRVINDNSMDAIIEAIDKDDYNSINMSELVDKNEFCLIFPDEPIQSNDASEYLILKHDLPHVAVSEKEQIKFLMHTIDEALSGVKQYDEFYKTNDFPILKNQLNILISGLNETVKLIGNRYKLIGLLIHVIQRSIVEVCRKLFENVTGSHEIVTYKSKDIQTAYEDILGELKNEQNQKRNLEKALKRDVNKMNERNNDLNVQVFELKNEIERKNDEITSLLEVNENLRRTITENERQLFSINNKSTDVDTGAILGIVPRETQLIWDEVSSFCANLPKGLEKQNIDTILPPISSVINSSSLFTRRRQTSVITSFQLGVERKPPEINNKLHYSNFLTKMQRFGESIDSSIKISSADSRGTRVRRVLIYQNLEKSITSFITRIQAKYKMRLLEMKDDSAKQQSKYIDQINHAKEVEKNKALWIRRLFSLHDVLNIPKDIKIPDDYHSSLNVVCSGILEIMARNSDRMPSTAADALIDIFILTKTTAAPVNANGSPRSPKTTSSSSTPRGQVSFSPQFSVSGSPHPPSSPHSPGSPASPHPLLSPTGTVSFPSFPPASTGSSTPSTPHTLPTLEQKTGEEQFEERVKTSESTCATLIDFMMFVSKWSKNDISVDLFRKFFAGELPFYQLLFYCDYFLKSSQFGATDKALRTQLLNETFGKCGYTIKQGSTQENLFCGSQLTFLVFSVALYQHAVERIAQKVSTSMRMSTYADYTIKQLTSNVKGFDDNLEKIVSTRMIALAAETGKKPGAVEAAAEFFRYNIMCQDTLNDFDFENQPLMVYIKTFGEKPKKSKKARKEAMRTLDPVKPDDLNITLTLPELNVNPTPSSPTSTPNTPK